ncbi:hypothetical protein [Aeromonas hydrophila]|uniref:hypothetical protein n=1 Tax=Aeromonas hydrophila TaxID=644 RepID=UPI002360A488|nr:hypothetical protein [Aeromonas hydrophila]
MSYAFCIAIALVLFAWIGLFTSDRQASRVDRQTSVLWLLAMGGVAAFAGIHAIAYGPWVILAGFVAVNGLAIQAVSFWFGYSWCDGIEIQG